ncbi:AAA family ATPase [Candidatus Micrarchaeota archaeon]|nr:AAA family ATPase [Candidatus Micrarchaeota archaeon]
MAGRKSNPTDAKTYYQMGNEYYEKGDYDKAIENYNMAILLNPVFSEAYFNRALSYYQLKNFDKSISDYTKSMELDPQNPIIYNNRGDAFYRKQDFQSAVKDYDKAISLNPNYLKAYYNRGLSYASIEEYEKAVEDFSKVLKLKPDFAEAYHLRGLAYEYAGSLSNAVNDYEKALELNPELAEAKTHLESAKAKKDQEGKGGGKEGAAADIQMLTKPDMNFEDVAGMDKMKEEIREAVVYPMTNPELARKYGKLGGGGILMYGPPGCGKTFIVKAAAGECGAGFINAKLSDLLDMYVGNTEKNIHKVFELARKNIPCILFFDEVDAIGGRRDMGEGAQYMKMAVNQMLYEMDGVEANNQNVLIIAATNAPWDVDPALRRSGRFSKTIYISEPDYGSRVAIIKMHAKKRPLTKFIPFTLLGLATMGYASADHKAIVDNAATIPWKEAFLSIEKRMQSLIKSGMSKEEAEEIAKKQVRQRSISLGDFVKALSKKRSSLPPWYEQANKQIGKQEEITIIDGKEHKKVTESKMGAGERDAFRDLLNAIKSRNQWYTKLYLGIIKNVTLSILRAIVFVTERGRVV